MFLPIKPRIDNIRFCSCSGLVLYINIGSCYLHYKFSYFFRCVVFHVLFFWNYYEFIRGILLTENLKLLLIYEGWQYSNITLILANKKLQEIGATGMRPVGFTMNNSESWLQCISVQMLRRISTIKRSLWVFLQLKWLPCYPSALSPASVFTSRSKAVWKSHHDLRIRLS